MRKKRPENKKLPGNREIGTTTLKNKKMIENGVLENKTLRNRK